LKGRSGILRRPRNFFLSFGSLNKLNCLAAPRRPYRVDEGNIFKRGNSRLVEVPLSAYFAPYVGTTMRIFPALTAVQRQMAHLEATLNGKPVVFDIHPNEFIDESVEKRTIHKRSRNPVTYLLKDIIRSQLKIKNLGPRAIPLYRKEIAFYHTRGYRFPTIRTYCEALGLL